MKIMNKSRKEILKRFIDDGDSCVQLACGDKFNKYNHHDILKKGSEVSKEDYIFAIESIGQKVAHLSNAINSYKDALDMLKNLRK